jgi:hypothetical protein
VKIRKVFFLKHFQFEKLTMLSLLLSNKVPSYLNWRFCYKEKLLCSFHYLQMEMYVNASPLFSAVKLNLLILLFCVILFVGLEWNTIFLSTTFDVKKVLTQFWHFCWRDFSFSDLVLEGKRSRTSSHRKVLTLLKTQQKISFCSELRNVLDLQSFDIKKKYLKSQSKWR